MAATVWDGSSYVDVAGATRLPDRGQPVQRRERSPPSPPPGCALVLQSGQASVGLLEIRAYTTATAPGAAAPAAGARRPTWSRRSTRSGSTWSRPTRDLYGFRNYGWDQVFANGGSINYCVRWDSSAPVTAALRDQIHAALARQFKKWMDVMAGHNGWPYADVPLKVVGWAVRDRATLQWSDNSVDVYVNNIRENAPQCSEPCGRFFNQNGNYPGCPGGAAHHYDMSLWLTAGMVGGVGGDWGQRVGSEYLVATSAATTSTSCSTRSATVSAWTTSTTGPRPGGGFLMKAGSRHVRSPSSTHGCCATSGGT